VICMCWWSGWNRSWRSGRNGSEPGKVSWSDFRL